MYLYHYLTWPISARAEDLDLYCRLPCISWKDEKQLTSSKGDCLWTKEQRYTTLKTHNTSKRWASDEGTLWSLLIQLCHWRASGIASSLLCPQISLELWSAFDTRSCLGGRCTSKRRCLRSRSPCQKLIKYFLHALPLLTVSWTVFQKVYGLSNILGSDSWSWGSLRADWYNGIRVIRGIPGVYKCEQATVLEVSLRMGSPWVC